jgi:ATP/maltotriose-dependent transcriptional regulator MalT
MSGWWRNFIASGAEFDVAESAKGKRMRGEKVVLAKITRPRFKLTYLRTDLHGLLDELRSTPLIMVSGPPGSGKSTLVASYIESRNIPCLWYHLDQGDEDLAIFFYYLGIAALKTNPSKKTALPRMSLKRDSNISALAQEYFHKLYRCLESPFMIVFDDHHEISKGSALHEVLQEACAGLPKFGRIVLISRNECPAEMACLHTKCSKAVIGREELQLSPAEIKEIAALHGVTLPTDDSAHQLNMKIDGSVAELIRALQGGTLLPSSN